MMERNISSLGETLNRFIEAQRTPRKQVSNEDRYSTSRSPIREKYIEKYKITAGCRQKTTEEIGQPAKTKSNFLF